MEEQQPMTNEEVTNDIRAVYESWWKRYRDQVITKQVLDEAFASGKELIEKHPSKLMLDMVMDLLKVLVWRRVS